MDIKSNLILQNIFDKLNNKREDCDSKTEVVAHPQSKKEVFQNNSSKENTKAHLPKNNTPKTIWSVNDDYHNTIKYNPKYVTSNSSFNLVLPKEHKEQLRQKKDSTLKKYDSLQSITIDKSENNCRRKRAPNVNIQDLKLNYSEDYQLCDKKKDAKAKNKKTKSQKGVNQQSLFYEDKDYKSALSTFFDSQNKTSSSKNPNKKAVNHTPYIPNVTDSELANWVYGYKELLKQTAQNSDWILISDILHEYHQKTGHTEITEPRLLRVLQHDSRFKSLISGSKLFIHKQYNTVKKPQITPLLKMLKHPNGKTTTGRLPAQTPPANISKVKIKDDGYKFMAEYDYLINHSSTKDKDDFPTIGLDFGTSFTKVAFYNSNYDKGIIPFGDLSMKASVIYTNHQNSILSMFETDKANQQVRYFKATVMDNRNYRTLSKWSSDFSFIASVFFIANILKFVKLKLSAYLNSNIEFQVNLGIPTLNDAEITETYRKILHCATIICDNGQDIREVDFNTMRKWISEAKKCYDSSFYEPGMGQHATFPELFAEALYLLERNDYGPAFYSIVDIGGGTTDMMFLIKRATFDQDNSYSCFYASVEPTGNEVRKKMDKVFYESNFISSFNKMIIEGKKYTSAMGVVKTLLFGGGKYAEEDYYEQLINRNGLDKTQSSFSIKVDSFECSDISFIEEESIANGQNKSPLRFITAYRLAVNTDSGERLQMLRPQNLERSPSNPKDDYLEHRRAIIGYDNIN